MQTKHPYTFKTVNSTFLYRKPKATPLRELSLLPHAIRSSLLWSPMLLVTFGTVTFLLHQVLAGRTVSAPVRFVLPYLIKAIPSPCVILLSLSLVPESPLLLFLGLGFHHRKPVISVSLSHTPLPFLCCFCISECLALAPLYSQFFLLPP